jgi:hypothetical protein
MTMVIKEQKIRIWADKKIWNYEGLIRQSNFLGVDKELSLYLSGCVVGPACQVSLSLAPLSQSGYSLDSRLRTFLRFIITRFDFLFYFANWMGRSITLFHIFIAIVVNFLTNRSAY